MSTVPDHDALLSWIACLPYWQRAAWAEALSNDSLDDAALNDIYEMFLEHYDLSDTKQDRPPIDLPSTSPDPPQERTRLTKMTCIKNVNAIADNQEIPFSSTLTVIYGVNGAGKTGFARVLSQACEYKGKRSPIHPNLLGPNTQKSAFCADLDIEQGSETAGLSQKSVRISPQDGVGSLRGFRVFDAACVRVHVTEKNTLTVVPSRLRAFATVASVFDTMGSRLQTQISLRSRPNPLLMLFDEHEETGALVYALNYATSLADLEQCAQYTETHKSTHEYNCSRLESLLKLNVPEKTLQLTREISELQQLLESLVQLQSAIPEDLKSEIKTMIDDYMIKSEVVKGLGLERFSAGLYRTAGGAEWQALLLSAKVLLDAERKDNAEFTLTHCPLCQQPLDTAASSLFDRYWTFLKGRAQTDLAAAKERIAAKKAGLIVLQAPSLDADAPGARILHQHCPAYLEELRNGAGSLVSVAQDLSAQLGDPPAVSLTQTPSVTLNLSPLTALIDLTRQQLASLADPALEIDSLRAKCTALQQRALLSQNLMTAKQYIEDCRWVHKARSVSIPKAALTKKQTELFNLLVTEDYRKRFVQECSDLGVGPVVEISTEGHKGQTLKSLYLNFAPSVPTEEVLSEGEQRAYALADCLAEAGIDQSCSGIIFDDPVTSLDHLRRDVVARRLVMESKSRQVIVFTHDIVFLSALRRESDQHGIQASVHWIQRQTGAASRVLVEQCPFTANRTSINREIDSAYKKAKDSEGQEQQRHLGDCFSYLRSYCEALIEDRVFNGTVKRWDDQIKVNSLCDVKWSRETSKRLVDLVNEISSHIPAHNRSDTMKSVPPTLETFKVVRDRVIELENEIKGIK